MALLFSIQIPGATEGVTSPRGTIRITHSLVETIRTDNNLPEERNHDGLEGQMDCSWDICKEFGI